MSPLPLDRVRLLQAAAALVLLGWRLAVQPAGSLWRDWMVVIAVYGLATAVSARDSLRTSATAAVAAYLLGIYVQGQAPYALTVLGLLP